VAHLVLDGDLDADVEALIRRDHVSAPQTNRWIALAIQQRFGQQVLARAVARGLRHARRKFGTGLLAHRRFVDRELVDGNIQVEPRLRRVLRDEHRAGEMMRRDHVIVSEARHRTAAIHQDLQQRFLRNHGECPRARRRNTRLDDRGRWRGDVRRGRPRLTGREAQQYGTRDPLARHFHEISAAGTGTVAWFTYRMCPNFQGAFPSASLPA
jgi:hypothetical protein